MEALETLFDSPTALNLSEALRNGCGAVQQLL